MVIPTIPDIFNFANHNMVSSFPRRLQDVNEASDSIFPVFLFCFVLTNPTKYLLKYKRFVGNLPVFSFRLGAAFSL